MKKILSLTFLTVSFSYQAVAETETDNIKNPPLESNYQLEQVVILSRHGIRAPLIGYGSDLAMATPYQWVTWNTKGGHLTLKGGKLEGLFAQYLDNWLSEEGLIAAEICPKTEVFIYTNSLPRTIESGGSFIAGAYPNCDVKVHHLEEVGKMDNTFNPIVRSEVNESFITRAINSVNEMLGDAGLAGLNERLKNNYQVLESILDYENSKNCQQKTHCHLENITNDLSFVSEEEPKITGPIRLGTGAADSFILQYYEGYPADEVAWGKIQTPEQWQAIADIKNLYTDLLFTSPIIAKEVAPPLATFIQNTFTHQNNYRHPFIVNAQNAKLTVLVGHDSNIASLLALLKVKPYQLEGQYEKTPISGKVAFERWKNKTTKQSQIKIEYMYQTADQLRDSIPLTKETPPKRVILEMTDCPIDTNGFCPLEDFDRAIKKALL